MPAALVLGARHLGGAIVDRFAARGYDIAAVSLSKETASLVLQRHPKALALAADTADPDQLESVIGSVLSRFGSLDAAVNTVSPRPRAGVFGGGPLLEAAPDAVEPYSHELVPQVFHFLRLCGRVMARQGQGTLVQVTGGSARRAIAGRGAWAAGAFATRALAQAAALELRERGVHAALLIVDAIIESEKTSSFLVGQKPDSSTTHDDVADAVEFLVRQRSRGWTHELVITPAGDRWVP